jgi:hypothetical protein
MLRQTARKTEDTVALSTANSVHNVCYRSGARHQPLGARGGVAINKDKDTWQDEHAQRVRNSNRGEHMKSEARCSVWHNIAHQKLQSNLRLQHTTVQQLQQQTHVTPHMLTSEAAVIIDK